MAFCKHALSLLVLLVVSDCSWAEEKELSVSELLWRANKDLVHTDKEPFIMDDIAYDNERQRNADPCTAKNCKWKKSRNGKVYVPYVIAPQYSSKERSIIEYGMQSFHRVSCIRFIPRTKQQDYLNIQSLKGCYSYVGRRGNAQRLSLARRDCLHHKVIQHELLHALGFRHEQSRSDRDQHIRVLWQNIMDGKEGNFKKYETLNLNTPYDYNSVMHYSRKAFSKNDKPTLEAIPDPNVKFGKATEMSKIDIIRVNTLYKC